MIKKRDLELPRKIDLYASSLLSIEKEGYIDSIILPENFTGRLYSFFSPDSNKEIELTGKTFLLFSQKIYFKGQPIGIFIHPDSFALNIAHKQTKVYYFQEDNSFSTPPLKTEKWQSFPRTGLEESAPLVNKKTECHPIFVTQEQKKKTSLLFEFKKEGSYVLWLPCTISPWIKESLRSAFPSEIYGKILLKSLYNQYSDINLSLLFLFTVQLLFVGLKEKKNIHLHSDALLLRKSSNPTGSLCSYYSKTELGIPLYHELNLTLPFSLRWNKGAFKKALQETLLLNLFPSKISLILSTPENHPLFYTAFEDILIPVCDLIHEHIETYLRDFKLSYYKGCLTSPAHTKKRTVLDLLTSQSDFLRKNYSYARQEIFAHEKFSFPIKKGIGLSLFQLGIDLSPYSFNFQTDARQRTLALHIPQLPVHAISLSIFRKSLNQYLYQKGKSYNTVIFLEKMLNKEPSFREEWDWQLDRPLTSTDPSKPDLINFEPYLESQLIGCVVELKAEPWIHKIEIIHIHVVMKKGKKDQIELERDRLITSIQHFLYQEIPDHLRIINNWESCLDLLILEEGSGSFINLPYAFRNAFFTALRQTNVLPAFKGEDPEINCGGENNHDS